MTAMSTARLARPRSVRRRRASATRRTALPALTWQDLSDLCDEFVPMRSRHPSSIGKARDAWWPSHELGHLLVAPPGHIGLPYFGIDRMAMCDQHCQEAAAIQISSRLLAAAREDRVAQAERVGVDSLGLYPDQIDDLVRGSPLWRQRATRNNLARILAQHTRAAATIEAADLVQAARSAGSNVRDVRDAAHEVCHFLHARDKTHHLVKGCDGTSPLRRDRVHDLLVIAFPRPADLADAEVTARAVEMIVCRALRESYDLQGWIPVCYLETATVLSKIPWTPPQLEALIIERSQDPDVVDLANRVRRFTWSDR